MTGTFYYCQKHKEISDDGMIWLKNLTEEKIIQVNKEAWEKYLEAWPIIKNVWEQLEDLYDSYDIECGKKDTTMAVLYPSIVPDNLSYVAAGMWMFLNDHYECGVEIIHDDDEVPE